jgi:hypothetical protein
MIVKYISGVSKKEFILNQSYELNISECNPNEVSWGYEGIETQYGTRIKRFTKSVLTLAIRLKFRGSLREINDNLNDFFIACEEDIKSMKEGRLYVNDEYVTGFFVSRTTTPATVFYGYENQANFLAPYPFWIKEESKTFMPQDGTSVSGDYLDYPYDYAYDYTGEVKGSAKWLIDHFGSSQFNIKIFGYVNTPKITINGHLYQVNVTINDGDYLEIDSRDNSIILHRDGGIKENMYYMRYLPSNVFEPIPSGLLEIETSGTFLYNITLFLERSEPRWS